MWEWISGMECMKVDSSVCAVLGTVNNLFAFMFNVKKNYNILDNTLIDWIIEITYKCG